MFDEDQYTKKFNKKFRRAIEDHIAELASSGVTEISEDDFYEVGLRPIFGRLASDAAANIREGQAELIRTTDAIRQGFMERLHDYWGHAFDLYFTATTCLQELGSDFNDSRRPAAAENNDLVFEALTGLHARACRTALEVHHLLAGGFPMGALARCRTLHELAVTAGIIQQYGRQPEHDDLAERYILHDHVMNWKDALEHQKYCDATGDVPFSDEEMAEFKASRDAVVAKFGIPFKGQNGWAAKLFPDKNRIDFLDLENLANLSHLRAYYKWSSHEIHADAKGWRLNRGHRGEATYLTAGHVNFGISEPGQLSLHSLNLCTALLVLSGNPMKPSDLVALMAIEELIGEADKAFVEAESSVHAAEERFQIELRSADDADPDNHPQVTHQTP